MKRLIVSIAMSAALAACTNTKDGNGLVVFDIASNVGHENIGSFDDLFEIKDYIQPELTDSSLMSAVDFGGIVGDTWYFSEARTAQTLMTFDSSGKCLASFSRVGNGPEEFGTENYVVVNPNTGNWYVNDAYGKQKVKSYTADGKFRGTSQRMFQQLYPDSEGVLAKQWTINADTIVLYRFDDQLNIVDSIVTPIVSDRVKGSFIGDRVAFESKDTIYSFLPDGGIGKIAYYELGEFKYPELTNEQMVEMASDGRLREINNKSIVPFIFSDGKIGIVSYRYDGKNVFQGFDMQTGDLIYSKTTTEHYVPFAFNGKEVGVRPVASWVDGSVIFAASPEGFGDGEGNPVFIRVTSKNNR